jgi:hypothetical protein
VVVDRLLEAAKAGDDDRRLSGAGGVEDRPDAGVADDLLGLVDVVEVVGEGHPGDGDRGVRGRLSGPVLDDQVVDLERLERPKEAVEPEAGMAADGREDHSRFPANRVFARRAACGHWTKQTSASG